MPIELARLERAHSSRIRASPHLGYPPPLSRASTHHEVIRDPEFQPPPDLRPSKQDRGWRKIVRNFTPSYVRIRLRKCHVLTNDFAKSRRWFTVTMGTGIVSILLHGLPYNGRWLYWISVGIFGFNILLFGIALFITILRYTLFPEIWTVMINEPFQSMFLGTFPMGFSTIVTMMILVCSPAWGEWVTILAWAFWIADSVVAVLCALVLPFLL